MVKCVSPKSVLASRDQGAHTNRTRQINDKIDILLQFSDLSQVPLDDKEFKSNSFQRVIQYLRRTIDGAALHNFTYTGTIEDTCTPKQGLAILLR